MKKKKNLEILKDSLLEDFSSIKLQDTDIGRICPTYRICYPPDHFRGHLKFRGNISHTITQHVNIIVQAQGDRILQELGN